MDRTRLLAMSLPSKPPRKLGPPQGIAITALLLLITACGQSPGINLTLDTSSTELVRGGEVQVEVTLTRTGGATADAQLTVTGLPDNVSASFSPETLSGAADTSTLTLSSTAAATEGDYALNVSATGTGLTSTAPLTLDIVSLEITGQVQTVIGAPAAGVAVRSQGETTVTDDNGAFELSGLSIPYDLSVWYTPGNWVQVYEGLTAAELNLAPVVAESPVGPSRSSIISGSLNGGSVPGALNQPITICAEGLDGFVLGCTMTGEGATSYSLGAQWYGDTSRQVRVHALQTERTVDNFATAYLGYGNAMTTLHDTVPTTANLTLGAELPTTTVSVDVDTSAAGIVGTAAAVQLGPNLAVPVWLVNSTASSQDIVVPVIAGTSYTFLGVASLQQYGWQAGVTGQAASVTVPGEPTLVSPPYGAFPIAHSAEFTANNPTGGPLTFEWTESGDGLSIAVTTMATTATLPDLTPYGLTLPGLTDFSWRVYAQSGSRTEDGSRTIRDYYNFFQLLLNGGSAGFEGAGTFAVSEAWVFTTSGP